MRTLTSTHFLFAHAHAPTHTHCSRTPQFLDPKKEAPIDIYRVMDRNGKVLDAAQDPEVCCVVCIHGGLTSFAIDIRACTFSRSLRGTETGPYP